MDEIAAGIRGITEDAAAVRRLVEEVQQGGREQARGLVTRFAALMGAA